MIMWKPIGFGKVLERILLQAPPSLATAAQPPSGYVTHSDGSFSQSANYMGKFLPKSEVKQRLTVEE
jgi:hypothetical protein